MAQLPLTAGCLPAPLVLNRGAGKKDKAVRSLAVLTSARGNEASLHSVQVTLGHVTSSSHSSRRVVKMKIEEIVLMLPLQARE